MVKDWSYCAARLRAVLGNRATVLLGAEVPAHVRKHQALEKPVIERNMCWFPKSWRHFPRGEGMHVPCVGQRSETRA